MLVLLLLHLSEKLFLLRLRSKVIGSLFPFSWPDCILCLSPWELVCRLSLIVCISTFSSDCNVLKDMVQMCFHTEDSTKYSTRCLINTSQWKNKWINSKPARKNTFSIASRIGLDVFIGSLICSHVLHICQSNIFSLSAERSTQCWLFWSLRKHYAMAKWWLYFILVSICIGKQLLSTFANDFS